MFDERYMYFLNRGFSTRPMNDIAVVVGAMVWAMRVATSEAAQGAARIFVDVRGRSAHKLCQSHAHGAVHSRVLLRQVDHDLAAEQSGVVFVCAAICDVHLVCVCACAFEYGSRCVALW